MITQKIAKQLKDSCSIYSTCTQKEDEAGWLAARSKGIGGSDIGTICGVNPWSSARLLYLAKTGQYGDSDGAFDNATKERMYFGHVLEPIIADEYVQRTGNRVVSVNATFVHNKYPWALANVDRFIVDEDNVATGVLECKSAGEYQNAKWEDGDIPLHYIYQLQWYMEITGFKQGAFAALVGGNKFHIIDVWRNDDLVKEILERAHDFWHNNVLKLVPPELDGADASTEYVKEQYKDVVKNSEIRLEGDVYNDLAATVIEAKAHIKKYEKILDEASNRLKEQIGNNEIGYTNDYIVKWSPRTQNRLDTTKIKIEAPELYTKFGKTIEYRVFTVK